MTENFTALEYFKELCAIPHASGNTKAISDYCVDFAKKHGLSYIQDSSNNVVIYKEASKGYEDRPGVILQGHLDMVAEKEADSSHDFAKDALKLCMEGDFLHADGTTLGGDDGIAVAYALAVLAAEDIEHPALDAVFTVDEEIGMLGAKAFDASVLKGRYLLNCDSEEEGVLTVGCAGGVRADMSFEMQYHEIQAIACHVTLSGFTGGHSGVEIHKNRANAHKVFGRLLYNLGKEVRFSVASLEGGTKDNVIACQVESDLLVEEEDLTRFQEILRQLNEDLLNEYAGSDDRIELTVTVGDTVTKQVLTSQSLEILTFILMNLPDGVCKMNASIPELVETSLNCGILGIVGDTLKIGCLIRSSVESAKWALFDRLVYLCEMMGGECIAQGDYPGWQYRSESHLRDVFSDCYRRLNGKEPVITTIHAGLECGMFAGKCPDLDIISFGPNIHDIHTSKECLDVPSAYRTWKLILEVLKNL
jgi:dipeptidase D